MRKITSVLAALLAVALLGMAVSPGPVAAATNTTELHNETVSVDSDTTAIRTLAENTTGELTVNISGIQNGTETQLASGTLNATSGPNATDTYEYNGVNTSEYPEYRVVVTGEAAERVSVAKLQVVNTGGTGMLTLGGHSFGGTQLIGILIIVSLTAVAAYANRRR